MPNIERRNALYSSTYENSHDTDTGGWKSNDESGFTDYVKQSTGNMPTYERKSGSQIMADISKGSSNYRGSSNGYWSPTAYKSSGGAWVKPAGGGQPVWTPGAKSTGGGGNGGSGGGSGTGGNNWQDSLAEEQKAAQIADLYDQYKNGMITSETFATKSGQTVEQYEMSQKPTYSMTATPDTKKAEADAEALAREDAYRRYLNNQLTADQFYYETGILPQDYISQSDASTPITPQTSSTNGRTYSASSRPSSGAGAYSDELAADKAKQDQINAGQQTFYTNNSMTADNPSSTGFGGGNFAGTAWLEPDSGTGTASGSGTPKGRARTYAGGNVMVTDSGTGNRPVAPAPEPKPSPEEVLEEIYNSQKVYAGGNKLVPDNSTGNRIRAASQEINTPPDPRLIAGPSATETGSGNNTGRGIPFDTSAGYDAQEDRKYDSTGTTPSKMQQRFQQDYDRMKAQFPNYSNTALVDLILFSEMQNSGYETPYYQWIANSLR